MQLPRELTRRRPNSAADQCLSQLRLKTVEPI